MTVLNKKMNTEIERKLLHYPKGYITDTELTVLLGGTPDSRYSKIKRLIAQSKLLHIRRGLYCLTEAQGYAQKPHSFELAQFIYGPSYISLESALSFHQLIPEAVYTVTNATIKRSKTFYTPLAEFSFIHLPSENFYVEVELIKQNGYQYFMAKPWKAICDYIYCYKKNWNSLTPLADSLRVNIIDLPVLSSSTKDALKVFYHCKRINRFLDGIKDEY